MKTKLIRCYEENFVTLMNGVRYLNKSNRTKRFSMADSIDEMIKKNKLLKQRVSYLELKQIVSNKSVTVK